MSDTEENDLNQIAAAAAYHHDAPQGETSDEELASPEGNYEECRAPPRPAVVVQRASPVVVARKRAAPSNSDDSDDDDRPSTVVRAKTSAPEQPQPVASTGGAANNNSHVVATHYNTLEECGLAARAQSRIVFMRNFNNWIKGVLLKQFVDRIRDASKLGDPLRVLDMCCGKGGDLNKWEKANITHLICTDIAAVSVEQCEVRYKTMIERNANNTRCPTKLFSAEFFACDSTRTQLRERYKDPSIELHLVSCQFAFHYCFESLKQAECMMRNAAECLRAGGYFVGTIPDAYEIVRRQRAANAMEFGNELYKIGFLCDAECPPLFGAKYNFQLHGVVDCPEFLVHFPMMVKLARKFGLELVMNKSFGEYFKEHIGSSRFS